MVKKNTDNGKEFSFTVPVPSVDAMHILGAVISRYLQRGDIILLSGPLGAGKTTLTQGIARGLNINSPVVSPTFTIAREMNGVFHSGEPMCLIHVDAYRVDSPDKNMSKARLEDELEALGLDEELESSTQNTVVLMEWGEGLIPLLSSRHLDILIDRDSVDTTNKNGTNTIGDSPDLSAGVRYVTLRTTDTQWIERLKSMQAFFENTSA